MPRRRRQAIGVNAPQALAFYGSQAEIDPSKITQPEENAMIMFSTPTRPMLMLLAGALVATQLAAVSAEARDGRQRQGHSRPHGDYSHQSQVQRTTSGHTRSDTWTNAQGRTASRDAVVVNDKQARTRTRDVQWQGPEGGQGSRHDVIQRTDDGYTRSSTATNAQGQTATRNATVVDDAAARTRSRNVTATGFDGGTRTVDDDLRRTDDGYSRQTTVTHPDGDVSSRDVTATYDSTNNVWSKDVSVERANGD
jgi:hypothetical protein